VGERQRILERSGIANVGTPDDSLSRLARFRSERSSAAGLVAQAAVFFQQLGNNPAEVREEVRIDPGSWRRCAIEDGLKNDRCGSEPEG